MRRYRVAWSIASEVVPIHSRKVLANTQPTIPVITPKMMPSEKIVWVRSWTFSIFFAPSVDASTTVAPREIPINKLIMRLIRGAQAPTAATAVSPTNCPTTTISAALKRSCRTCVRTIGTL